MMIPLKKLLPLVLSFSACSGNFSFSASLDPPVEVFRLKNPPVAGVTAPGQKVLLGGFSGLHFLEDVAGDLRFAAISDRGPNAEKLDIAGVGKNLRPLLIPAYQPRILIFRTDRKTQSLFIEKEIALKDFQGRALSGRPNFPGSKDGPNSDEPAVDVFGKPLPLDPLGIDTEGLTRDSEGNWWVCEEYRPSLLKFSAEGVLLKRFVPKGSYRRDQLKEFRRKFGDGRVVEALPEELKFRRLNNGFEGITLSRGKIVAALQSPISLSGKTEAAIRWIRFDPIQENTEAQFLYPIRGEEADKIGDLASEGDRIFVIEQNSKTGKGAIHDLFVVELPQGNPPGRVFLKKEKVLDLVRLGLDQDPKLEGLALLPQGRFAIVNDNDFGLAGPLDLKKGWISLDPARETKLFLGKITDGLFRN